MERRDQGLTHQILLAALEQSEGGVVVVDDAACVLFWNRWFTQHAGIPLAQARGRRLIRVFPELMGGRLHQAVENAIASGLSSFLSHTLNRSPLPLYGPGTGQKRERIQQQVQIKPISTPGAPRHCLIQVQDVTSAVRREHQLRQQAQAMRELADTIRRKEFYLDAILENALDGIIVVNPRGVVTTFNRAAQEIFQVDEAQILGRPLEALLLEEAPGKGLLACLREGDDHAAADGWRFETWGRRAGAGGGRFPLGVSARRISLDGEPMLVAVVRDISQLKQGEEELRRAMRKAEEASRAKSAFLANMSHEIRTPLNAILGMGELLHETRLTPDQRHYITIFQSAGDSLLLLINDLLDLSKIEAGQLVLDHLDFSLDRLLDEVGEVVGHRAQDKGIALWTRRPPQVPAAWNGDVTRLRQVLLNLVGNAVKFTERGEVTVTVAMAPGAGTGEAGDWLRFTVQDSGIGIPPDKLESIFEPFIQADSSITRRYGGTGLGLNICRRLVGLMGGEIWAESREGEGSRFHFTVRLERAQAALPLMSGAPPDLRGKRVAILGGTPTSRLILREMLSGLGEPDLVLLEQPHKLTRWQWRTHPLDLLILDPLLPEDMSLWLATLPREPGGGLRVPVLMLESGPTGGRSAPAGLQTLLKPLKRQSLLACLGRLLGNGASSWQDDGAHGTAPLRATAAASPPEKGRPLRILLAEDSDDNCLLFQHFIKGSGNHLVVVHNGREALERFRQEPFDLVFMDIQMPVMDGLQATREIRLWEREEGRHPVSVVALTAHAMQEHRASTLAAGCDLHMTKPIKKADLLSVIEEHSRNLKTPGETACGGEAPQERDGPG